MKMSITRVNIVFIFLSLILLINAIYIYLSNRNTDMLLYVWLGLDNNNCIFEYTRNHVCGYAPWIKYNLPDGLWLLSYLLFIEGIWSKEKLLKWLFCIPIIGFAFVLEFLQFSGIFSGTGDVLDIMSYILAILLFLFIIKLKQIYYEKDL